MDGRLTPSGLAIALLHELRKIHNKYCPPTVQEALLIILAHSFLHPVAKASGFKEIKRQNGEEMFNN